MARIKSVRLDLPTGSPQFEAVWGALVQFVDNNEEVAKTEQQKMQIQMAEDLITLFDAAYASLAEDNYGQD